MKIINQNSTIRDYRDALLRGDIVINRDYQRSNQVWPDMAKSYLMETILREFPIPKLFLHQTQNVKTRKPIKHIVDGQQRTQAIMDFLEDKFALSRAIETEELRGLSFSDLNQDYNDKFLDYGLSVDLFTAAPIEQVIEVFRRMNSYTVPLNPEEKRHAGYQVCSSGSSIAWPRPRNPLFVLWVLFPRNNSSEWPMRNSLQRSATRLSTASRLPTREC